MIRQCLLTGEPASATDPEVLVVSQGGQPVALISAIALREIKTLRLILSRDAPGKPFKGEQAQCIGSFDTRVSLYEVDTSDE